MCACVLAYLLAVRGGLFSFAVTPSHSGESGLVFAGCFCPGAKRDWQRDRVERLAAAIFRWKVVAEFKLQLLHVGDGSSLKISVSSALSLKYFVFEKVFA